jgi:hypothetical protein
MLLKLQVFFMIFMVSSPVVAESVKYLQWWDEYVPKQSELPTSLAYDRERIIEHFLDIDGDGVENDTMVCKPFNMEELFTPTPMCPRIGSWANYRTDRPSGKFYGGIRVNFLNASHVVENDGQGNLHHVFIRPAQDTVQHDGASPNLYNERFPHNITRALNRFSDLFWADMTLFAVDPGWTKVSRAFFDLKDGGVNFSALFFWKKEDFVNGGASAEKIVFDATSNIKVDLTRQWDNVEDARFVVQDGEQLWISEYQFEYLRTGYTISLNPLHSRWALYQPADCDLAVDIDKLEFIEHEFTDVQGVGAYFATYSFMTSNQDPTRMVFIFDNFQLFATDKPTNAPSERTVATVDVKLVNGLAIDKDLQPIATRSKFAMGAAVNGGMIRAKASDQLDIRGVIRPEPKHVGQKADIVAVIGYLPHINAKMEDLSAFMLNSRGLVLEWDQNLANLTALKWDVELTPEYRVQLLPVSITRFKHSAAMNSVVLSCDERPLTYTGIIGAEGILQIYYGYRLKSGELVYSSQPIMVELQPD